MTKSVKDLVQTANASVQAISAAEAKKLLAGGNAVALDVREPAEVAAGKVKGALAIPRGVLEFQAEPGPNRPAELSEDKTVIVYCAAGGRAAMAGQRLIEMGYKDVRNMGGFKDWVAEGGETE